MILHDLAEKDARPEELLLSDTNTTPVFLAKSAQAIENKQDDFRSFERERKSARERVVCAPLAEFARGKKE